MFYSGLSLFLATEELSDPKEVKEGLTPVTLAKWIVSKGQSYGSVYLLPFFAPGEEAGQQGTSGYRYAIVGTNQPSVEKHFYTLR